MFLPLQLTLRPSRIYRVILLLAHGLALVGIWQTALPVWIQTSMTAALLAAALMLWRENSKGPRGLRVSLSGQIEVLDGEWRPVEIRGQAVVQPWFISLTLASEEGGRHKLMLWPDSADADPLRKLRVWLRWAKTSVAA